MAIHIQALLDQGPATRGFTIKVRGGHVILGRVDDDGPDPRFRLGPLGGGRYGLSLYDRNRGDQLPLRGHTHLGAVKDQLPELRIYVQAS